MIETKICTKCGEEYPATTEYFHKDNRYKKKLRASCRDCSNNKTKKRHSKNSSYWKSHNPYDSNKNKFCSSCRKEYPKIKKHWYKNISRNDGLEGECKDCKGKKNVIYNKRWWKNNKQKARKSNRNTKLKKNYGITLEEYNKIFETQNGCCAICGRHQSEFDKSLCVDHDHKTGKIRGLLCNICNLSLWILEDDELAKKAKMYLKKYEVD